VRRAAEEGLQENELSRKRVSRGEKPFTALESRHGVKNGLVPKGEGIERGSGSDEKGCG